MQVVGVEDLVELLGPRKSVLGDNRYDEYLKKMVRPDEKEALGGAAEPPPPPPIAPAPA